MFVCVYVCVTLIPMSADFLKFILFCRGYTHERLQSLPIKYIDSIRLFIFNIISNCVGVI